MPNMKRTAILTAVMSLCLAGQSMAQEKEKEKKKVNFSAGLESNSTYYWEDEKTGAMVPEDNFGSNNYLKADISYGDFSAGAQAEAYLPAALQGYPTQYDGAKLTFKYASFEKSGFKLTVGDAYTQYGSGLLLRAWEDRALGINTSIEGGHASYRLGDIFKVSGLYGRQRYYLSYADSWLGGADVSFSPSALFLWDGFDLTLEGSYLNKNEDLKYPDIDREAGMKPSVNGYSARVAFDAGGFTLKGEMVGRQPDANIFNDFSQDKSRAYLVETGYTGTGIGMMLSLRKLQHMEMQSEHSAPSLYTQINYLPALTQQYTYALATLNPYQTQAGDEFGGQFDIYYNFARGTKLGGQRGTKVHLNVSAWGGKEKPNALQPTDDDNQLFYSDLGLDIEKQWNTKLKTKLLYSMQDFNPYIIGEAGPNWKSYVAVADVTWKFNRTHALRGELQHLWMEYDQKNWAAMLLEYSLAPKWSFFISDMWNYGDTDIHYYNGGASFTHSKARIAVNVGRFKEGYQCAGGVCRLIPAYTGANLALTLSF